MKRLAVIIALALSLTLPLLPQPARAGILPACDQTKYVLPKEGIANPDECDPRNPSPEKCDILDPDQYDDKYKEDADKKANPPSIYVANKCGFNDFVQLFINLADWGLGILAALSLLIFVWGGFTLVISLGSPEKIREGKLMIWGAILGISIVLTSWILIGFYVGALTGTGPVLFARYDVRRYFYGDKCSNYKACDTNNLFYDAEKKVGCKDSKGNQNAVSKAQGLLTKLGCYQDSIDGCFGPRSSEALASFQVRNLDYRLTLNLGHLDQDTWKDLEDAANGVAGPIGCTSVPLAADIDESSAGFSPAAVTIAAGGTATFTNKSGAEIWIVFDRSVDNTPGPPTFRVIPVNGTWTVTFPSAGEFGYHDQYHQDRTGRVIVSSLNGLGGTLEPRTTQVVKVNSGGFSPNDVSISRGSTVRFQGEASGPPVVYHVTFVQNPTGQAGTFEFDVNPGDSRDVIFYNSGTFNYSGPASSGGTVRVR